MEEIILFIKGLKDNTTVWILGGFIGTTIFLKLMSRLFQSPRK